MMARKLARRARDLRLPSGGEPGDAHGKCVRRAPVASAPSDEESDAGDADAHPHPHPPGWRKKANLRMYTILDKIF